MKSRLLLKGFLLIVMVAVATSCGSSRKSIGIEAGWELLGERKVNFIRDVDDIDVVSGNTFTAIRFRVEDKEIRLNYLKIYFANGDKLEPQVDDVIGANQSSRIIELGVEGKKIDKIEFKFRTLGNIIRGRANVLVFGKRFSYLGY